jgi:hypothetical protein
MARHRVDPTTLPELPDTPDTPDEAEATREAPVDPATPRRVRPVDPDIVALFAPGATVEHETIAAAQRAWREATQREAPSVERLAEKGTINRVDADLASGYLAVTTADDTWRAFVPQDQLALVIALMLRRPLAAVTATLAEGPGAVPVETA